MVSLNKKILSTVMMAALVLSTPTVVFADETASDDNSGSSITITIENGTDDTQVTESKTVVEEKEKAAIPETTETTQVVDTQAKEDTTTMLPGRPLEESPMKPGEVETEESMLVSAEWLKNNLKSVVVVDARPKCLYTGGHIPGAVDASWTYFAKMNVPQGSKIYGTIFSPVTMQKRLGALGINGKKPVVVYCDAGGWGQSGWTLMILRMCGIKNAKMLAGGLSAWKEAGGQLSHKTHVNKPVPFKVTTYVDTYVVDTDWINNNLGKEKLAILDVRTDGEYAGKIRPFGEKRTGHLPGAVQIEMSEFVENGMHYKQPEKIVSMLAEKGITPESEIVVYDTCGVRAAFVTMGLRYAGFAKVRCYDQGFQAWAGQPDLPMEK